MAWRRTTSLLRQVLANATTSTQVGNNQITSNLGNKLPSIALAAGLASVTCASVAIAYAEAPQASSSASQPQQQQPPPTSNEATAQWRVFTDMGRDMAAQKRFQEAEKYLVKALDAARRGFGTEDPHIASACNNLAELYRLTHKFDKAAPLYEEALHILAENYGSKDIRVAFALHNLGGFYFGQKDLDKALKYYEQALAVKLATVGPGHSETVNTLFHLAEVRWAAGQHKEALKFAQQALAAMDVMSGSDAAATRPRARYAEMLLQQGKYTEAEKQLRKNLEYIEGIQGLDGSGVAAAAENLALALQRTTGQETEAKTLLQRAFNIRTQCQHSKVSRALTLKRLAELQLQSLPPPPSSTKDNSNSQRPAEIATVQIEALSAAQGACQLAEEALSEASTTGISTNTTPNNPTNTVGSSSNIKDKVLNWIQPERELKKTLLHQYRPIRADAASIEYAECLQTLARVQLAVGEDGQAMEALQKAQDVLIQQLSASSSVGGSKEGGKAVAVAAAQKAVLCSVLKQHLLISSENVNYDVESKEKLRSLMQQYDC